MGPAASMVVESARICGRVGFVLGVTGWLGRAWWYFGAAWCYCMGACIIVFVWSQYDGGNIEQRAIG